MPSSTHSSALKNIPLLLETLSLKKLRNKFLLKLLGLHSVAFSMLQGDRGLLKFS